MPNESRPWAVTASRVAAVGFLLAAGISTTAAVSGARYGGTHVPVWFTALVAAGVAGLVIVAGVYAARLWAGGPSAEPEGGMRAAAVWGLIILSCLCVASLHRFLPFRPAVVHLWNGTGGWMRAGPVLKFNYVLTAAYLVAVVAMALLYASGARRAAVWGILLVGLAALVPNDNCDNPFNRLWLHWIGATPAMFVPSLLVILFGICALLGVWPRLSISLMVVVCACTLAIGLAHSWGVW